MKKLFISYSHKNIEKVSSLVNMIASPDIDIWIDEKSIAPGQRYTTAIFEAIHDSDVYVVCLSNDCSNSSWVKNEMDFAIKEKIVRQNFRVLPVLLEDCEIPTVLSNIDYIDGRGSVTQTAESLIEVLGIDKDFGEETRISGITFEISKETNVEVGPFCEETTKSDLEKNTDDVLKQLRKKAQGILINFVSISEFDLFSEIPRFKNGLISENVSTVTGSTTGSIRNRVSISITALNPDVKRLSRLLTDRLSVLTVSSMTIMLSNNNIRGEYARAFAVSCFERLQDEYTILSYDPANGAKIMYDEDVFLCIKCSEEGLAVKFETKYDWQFEDKFKSFSLEAFISWLIS